MGSIVTKNSFCPKAIIELQIQTTVTKEKWNNVEYIRLKFVVLIRRQKKGCKAQVNHFSSLSMKFEIVVLSA